MINLLTESTKNEMQTTIICCDNAGENYEAEKQCSKNCKKEA